MVQLNEDHGMKKPVIFGLELLEFYQANAQSFIEVETKKK